MSHFIFDGKRIFYEEAGRGKPLIMLHGDTASSRMFEFLLPLYQDNFRVILIDFLGNGRSDRVDRFPEDLWIRQAQQVIALIEYLGIEKVNLLILSRLVDTFFSRISLTMQPPPKPHSTACVLPWEEGRHWQSRSSGCSSS